MSDELSYPTAEEVLAIHEAVVASDHETEAGVRSRAKLSNRRSSTFQRDISAKFPKRFTRKRCISCDCLPPNIRSWMETSAQH